MELQTLGAKTRTAAGKCAARGNRRSGEVPAVLYGGGKDPVSLSLNQREFELLVHGRGGGHAIVQLEVGDAPDASSPALLKELQHHPLRGNIIHADFLRIRLDERITTEVPVVLVGQARGVVDGGVLDHQLRELEVECLALEVPEKIALDVSGLGLGDSLHVRDIVVPENVTVITDPDRAVAAVHVPRALAAAEGAPAEGAAGAEGAEGEGKASGEGEGKAEAKPDAKPEGKPKEKK